MNELARAYAITTPLRVAHFLAQIGTESKFRAVAENGNYDSKRMRQIFGCKGGPRNYDARLDDAKKGRLREKLWTDEHKYAHNAKNLLNYVYAARLGNGDEASGDGFRYRGRGMIQLTGKSNYERFTKTHNRKTPNDPQDFVANPDLVASDKRYAVESAFFFWDNRDLNKIADKDDIDSMTLRINGGYNGHNERKSRLAKLKHYLGITT